MNDNSSRVIDVDINDILPNRFQPRIQFDEEEILELSDSIKEHGVIQPIVVRTIGDKYEIIAGERRYKASVLAGKESVPVIVKNLNDKDSAEVALIENVQRKNLTPIEEALSYKKILDMGYITQENLADKLGKSQSSVANKIRLLNLSDEVQEALLENKISERHARSLLRLSTSKLQNEMLNRIISERLTVRRTDEEIDKMKNSESSEKTFDDSQKIIEKGEINMNNNMFGMPNVPQNQQAPSFDIFGASTPTQNTQPVEQPTAPVEPTMSSFDIFGGSQSQPELPQAPSIQEQPMSVPSAMPTMEPITPVVQSVPETPVVQAPVMPEFPAMNEMSFNFNQNIEQPPVPQMDQSSVQVNPVVNDTVVNPLPEIQPMSEPSTMPTMEPVAPVVQPVPETPVVQAPVMPEFPAMNEMSFNFNQNVEQPTVPQMDQSSVQVNPVVNDTVVNPLPEVQPMSEPSAMPTMEPVVPQTSPIMESPVIDNEAQMTQQSENLFSFGDNNLNTVQQESQPEVQPEPTPTQEFKMPEPIIITDYSKQYDPIMPQTAQSVEPTVDFKEVIAAIRECSRKIEQYGFKIDVEEYDLSNLYQVIFKIEK